MDTTYGMDTDNDNPYSFDLPGDAGSEAYSTPVEDTTVEDDQEDGAGDFWGNAFDAEEIEAALKVDLPPEGDYVGSSLVAEQRYNKFEGQPEVRLYGMVENAEGVTTRTAFTIEFKKRYKENGKVAWPYTMYKNCLAAFIKANGRQPSNGPEFMEFLTTAPLTHRISHKLDKSGVSTMGIKAVI